jgi:signal transduction histidine kinase
MMEILRRELLATDLAMTDFVSSISHELRSPLHGILGGAELLRDSPTDADRKRLIEMIENCGRTLLHTVDQM